MSFFPCLDPARERCKNLEFWQPHIFGILAALQFGTMGVHRFIALIFLLPDCSIFTIPYAMFVTLVTGRKYIFQRQQQLFRL